MKLHPNARLTPAGRWILIQRVHEEGRTVDQAAAASGVSSRTAYKWLARYRAEGRAGLGDRSSRPARSPHRTPAGTIRRIEKLRRRRKTAWEIAEELGIPGSTVSRILKHRGLGRLWRVQEAEAPPRRYEHTRPRWTAPRRCQEARKDPGDWPSDPRGLPASLAGHRLGDGLCLRRRLHAPGLRRSAAQRGRQERHGLLPSRAQTLRRAGHPRRARAHRQREVLRLEALPRPLRGALGASELHSTLHPAHQRQGGALHPDLPAALGLPATVPDLSPAHRSTPALDPVLQSSTTPSLARMRPPIQRLRENREQRA